MISYIAMPGVGEWFIVGIVFLILFVLPTTALIYLFIKSGRTGRIILLSLLVIPACLALLFFGSLFVVRTRTVTERTVGRAMPAESYADNSLYSLVAPGETYTSPENVGQSPTYKTRLWPLRTELADYYPSAESAAIALTRYLIIPSWKEVVPDRQEPLSVTIVGDCDVDQKILDKVVYSIRETIREHDLSLPITTAGIAESQPATETDLRNVILRIDVTIHELEYSTVLASIIGRAGEQAWLVSFANKPWVDNPAEYINNNPQDQWIIAQSTQPMPTREEAEKSAMTSAINQILGRIRPHVPPKVQNAMLPNLVEQDIHGYNLIADRFVQSFQKPYGQVWEEHLLLTLGDDKDKIIPKLAGHQATAYQQNLETTISRKVLAPLGMVVLILAVYGFLNAATRGYYTWSLRIAGIVCAAGVLFMILNYA